MTAGALAAYSDAVVRAARDRYPDSTLLRVAWQCGWNSRRNGSPRSTTDAFGPSYTEAWLAGWDAAVGSWDRIAPRDLMPRPLNAQGDLGDGVEPIR